MTPWSRNPKRFQKSCSNRHDEPDRTQSSRLKDRHGIGSLSMKYWTMFERRILPSAALAFFLLGGNAATPAIADDRQAAREGRALTKQCKVCHQLRRPKRKFGPHLVGVIGRPVASVPKFRYSEGLQRIDGAWTPARLAAFLNDPQAFAPGTDMKFSGFKDMAKAQTAAAYIARITQP